MEKETKTPTRTSKKALGNATKQSAIKENPNAVVVECSDSEVGAEFAKAYLRPTVLAANSIKTCYSKDNELNINELIIELEKQTQQMHKGSMEKAESILFAQAHTLDALFADLTLKAKNNLNSGYIDAFDKFMKLALKTQSQCRTTLESLSAIKNPKPYIQNNRAQYQQVNNAPQNHTRAEENIKQANELLD